jgi:hypothetical protein
MIWQHPVLDKARQRQAEALAQLLMLALLTFLALLRGAFKRMLPARKNKDSIKAGVSLNAEEDEREIEM